MRVIGTFFVATGIALWVGILGLGTASYISMLSIGTVAENTSVVARSDKLKLSVVEVQMGVFNNFPVQVNLNGVQLIFFVDTGASYVSITPSALAKIGPVENLGLVRMTIADGKSYDERLVRVAKVTVGDIVLQGVEATILPNDQSPNLLGMSFLKRIEFEFHGGRLLLHR